MATLDLDVDSPDKVKEVLQRAAQAYYESAGELESAWQDKSAGRPWLFIARQFEALADKLGKKGL